MNKCFKCGYHYGIDDIYCAKCGAKLLQDDNDELNEKNEEIVQNALFLKLKSDFEKKSKNSKIFEFFNKDKKNIFDSALSYFLVLLIVLSIFLCIVFYFTTQSQVQRQSELKFRSLINNPQQIPQLRIPKDYSSFVNNISDVEKFLVLYLKYSDNEENKKEQIFASYLVELDKLSNLLAQDSLSIDSDECSLETIKESKSCSVYLNKMFEDVGVKIYSKNAKLFIYPDYKFLNEKFSKYFTGDLKNYLNLLAKYNEPTSLDLNLYVQPKKLANKITDFENLSYKVENQNIKDEIEKQLYNDFRKFIFIPSIYATTSQEMKKEFKQAYEYFLSRKKNSAFYPLILSYMDKQKSYSEENFKNDYPFKKPELTFEENVKKATVNDIFSQLRKNMFSKNSKYVFQYVYNVSAISWSNYKADLQASENEYVISMPDENNSVAIYTNNFSLLQELNLPKYSQLYLIDKSLYIYDSDRLSLSKIVFNGKDFTIRKLSLTDVTSVFPGIEVINIDFYSNYNVKLTKENTNASYIVLSRYSQGYNKYSLSAIKGDITMGILPNMFSVSTKNEVIATFHSDNLNPEATSDSSPTYKFVIRTKKSLDDNAFDDSGYIKYDEKTAQEEMESKYEPTMMPKIVDEDEQNLENKEKDENIKTKEEVFVKPPKQDIVPPREVDINEFDIDEDIFE